MRFMAHCGNFIATTSWTHSTRSPKDRARASRSLFEISSATALAARSSETRPSSLPVTRAPGSGRRQYNSTPVPPAFFQGNFSSSSRQIRDPLTGQPFPGNIIPADRIVSSAKFFFPYILQPNSADGRFRAVASQPSDTDEVMVRIDQQLTDKQRIYGRYVINDFASILPQYRPELPRTTVPSSRMSASITLMR